jgi:adenosylcobinamide-GDP ribazoletransferase
VIAAISLLTRIPVRTDGTRAGAWAFGVVGAVLGLAAAAPLLILAPLPGAVLTLAVLAIASGALHLDGLADTADALAAPNPEAAERARHDPRVGAAGVVAIVLVLAVDATALAQSAAWSAVVAGAALLAAASTSRAIATAVPFVAGEARPGFGRWFADRTQPVEAVFAIATSVVVAGLASLVAQSLTPALAGVAALIGGGLAAVVLGRLRGGLDGDACGAVIELALAAGLIASSVAA